MSPELVQLLSTAAQPAIFAALFIYLFISHNKDARERELWFRDALERQAAQLERIALAVERIDGLK